MRGIGPPQRGLTAGDGVPASRLQLPPGPWATVLDGLCARFPAIDRAQWQDRMRRGRVVDADGHPVTSSTAYRVGLEVRYFREVRDERLIPFEAEVLHRDAHLLVADKPHFLPVMPAGDHVEQTLLARLRRDTGIDTLVPLHRIDRDTAGLVMFSIDPASRGRYQALFRERAIDKTYHALAPPLPDLAFPLLRRSRLVRGEPFFRMRETAGEANAETGVDPIERDGDTWRYALRPVSGRKHQLRVHMAALGAPIVGDPLYPAVVPTDDRQPFAHPLQLLARELAFIDPLTGARRVFLSRRALAR